MSSWLVDPGELDPADAAELLAPAPDDLLIDAAASTIVNSPKVDHPGCVEPAEDEAGDATH